MTDTPNTDQWYAEARTSSFSESSFWNDITFALCSV